MGIPISNQTIKYKPMKTITFNGYTLSVEHGTYRNGQNAIDLTDTEDGSPFMTASVSLETDLKEDEVAIKDYSENEGVLDALIEHGMIEAPHKVVEIGYVQIPICKLSRQPKTTT